MSLLTLLFKSAAASSWPNQEIDPALSPVAGLGSTSALPTTGPLDAATAAYKSVPVPSAGQAVSPFISTPPGAPLETPNAWQGSNPNAWPDAPKPPAPSPLTEAPPMAAGSPPAIPLGNQWPAISKPPAPTGDVNQAFARAYGGMPDAHSSADQANLAKVRSQMAGTAPARTPEQQSFWNATHSEYNPHSRGDRATMQKLQLKHAGLGFLIP